MSQPEGVAAVRAKSKQWILLVSKLMWDVVLPIAGVTGRPFPPSILSAYGRDIVGDVDLEAPYSAPDPVQKLAIEIALEEPKLVLWSSNGEKRAKITGRPSHSYHKLRGSGQPPKLGEMVRAERESIGVVMSLAGALFPLVGVAYRYVASHCDYNGATTAALWFASRNAAIRCMASLVCNDFGNHTIRNNRGNGVLDKHLVIVTGGDLDKHIVMVTGGDGRVDGKPWWDHVNPLWEKPVRVGRRRANVKELVTMLTGLCVGGHREEAKRLVDGALEAETNGCLWWPKAPASGHPRSDDVHQQQSEGLNIEYLVRDTRVLEFVCENGDLDTAMWLVDKFGIPKWELLKAWTSACHSGNIELFSWLYSGFTSLGIPFFSAHPAISALKAGKVDFCKWAFENFSVGRPRSDRVYPELGQEVVTEEFLYWLFKFKNFPLPSERQMKFSFFDNLLQLETVKWFMDHVPLFVPSIFVLNMACRTGNLQLVQWLLKEYHITPTMETFRLACFHSTVLGCSTPPDTVKLILQGWPEQPPSEKDLIQMLRNCLMEGTVSAYTLIAQTYPKVVDKAVHDMGLMHFNYSSSGKYDAWQVSWYLKHFPFAATMLQVAFSSCVQRQCFQNAFILLGSSTYFGERLVFSLFDGLIKYGSLPQIQKLLSMCHFFRKSDVVDFFSRKPDWHKIRPVSSSKAVKWLVCELNMTAEDIRKNNNALLFWLYHNNKIHCAEWLITRFYLGASDIIKMSSHIEDEYCLPVAAFLSLFSLIRPFPELSFVHYRLLRMVLSNPCAVELAVAHGLMSKPEAKRYYKVLLIHLQYPHPAWAKEYFLTP